MGFIEWIGESYNPGPTGNITRHSNQRERTRLSAICTGIVALGVLTTPFYFLYKSVGADAEPFMILLAVFAVYLLVSYYVRPNPDTSNIGWCGGLIDNPFRYSDDLNRMLIFLEVILLPGRLVSIGIVDLVRAFYRPGRC